MNGQLLIGLISAHSLIRDLLSLALVERGHRVTPIDPVPIGERGFTTVHALSSDCDVVVVTSWGMTRGGHHLVRHLCAVDPRRRIVLIETAPTDHDLRASFRTGATAVIGMRSGLEEAVGIIESAALGDSYAGTMANTNGSTPRVSRTPVLSRRETEVLQLVVDGFDVRTISAQLFISAKTVKHHLSSIYAKLGTTNRTEAVVRGLRKGLVEITKD